MPKQVTTTKTLYTFEELSDDAKEKARNWWREASAGDTFYSESVIDDAERIGAILGIEFDRRRQANPKAKGSPCVYWSGFWSQGDGASFEGSYSYAKGAA